MSSKGAIPPRNAPLILHEGLPCRRICSGVPCPQHKRSLALGEISVTSGVPQVTVPDCVLPRGGPADRLDFAGCRSPHGRQGQGILMLVSDSGTPFARIIFTHPPKWQCLGGQPRFSMGQASAGPPWRPASRPGNQAAAGPLLDAETGWICESACHRPQGACRESVQPRDCFVVLVSG